jgi:hypothetical protein
MINETTSDIGDRGEALVKGKLEKLGFKVTRRGPRARNYDMTAECDGRTINVQVKSFRWKNPTLDPVTKFIKIDIIDECQKVRGLRPLIDPNAIWVWVYFAPDETISFYLMTEAEVQEIIHRVYGAFLEQINFRRKRNPYSLHTCIPQAELEQRKDNWTVLTDRRRFVWEEGDIQIVNLPRIK